jgi:hypothetical protein
MKYLAPYKTAKKSQGQIIYFQTSQPISQKATTVIATATTMKKKSQCLDFSQAWQWLLE